jgi:HEPN domain-containing protein
MSAAEARRWLRFAHEDLLAAEAQLGQPGAFPRHSCWLAQQSAEKTLKAAFIFLEMEFPFSHDLDRLRDLLPPGWPLKSDCPDLAELTEWAVEARYPGDMPDAVEADARLAVEQPQAVWKSVNADLAERGLTGLPEA